jgi:hypothetical protein
MMLGTEIRRIRPGVEQLEARQLLSVTVLPGHINLKSASHGNGVVTVRVLADTSAGKTLVSATNPLVYSVIDKNGTSHALGTPLSTQPAGTDALIVKFRRSAFQGLNPGALTLQVATQDGSTEETGTFTLFAPGGGAHGHHDHHHDGHHNHGHQHPDHHGHGKGNGHS